MKRNGPVLIGLLLAALALTATTAAQAQQMSCDIHSIRASASGADIAGALNIYRAQLLRPPLNTFTSFNLVGTQSVTLAPGASATLRLGAGIDGQLRFLSAEGQLRIFNLSLRQSRQNLVNSQVAMTPGRPFFVVVPPINPENTLVLGIICR